MNFDFLDETSSPKVEKIKDASITVEALQIVRIVKGTMGNRRDTLDTIKIDERGGMSYERALKIAKYKAEKIGNCMVVEKIERVVCAY